MARFSLASRPLKTENLVPLFFAIIFACLQVGELIRRGTGLLCYLRPFCAFCQRQNLSSARNALVKIFLRTLFMQDLALDGLC